MKFILFSENSLKWNVSFSIFKKSLNHKNCDCMQLGISEMCEIPLVIFAQQLHISFINTPNIVSERWINFSSLKFSNNWFMKLIWQLIISFISDNSSTRFFIKKFVNHWCLSSLKTITFWITRNFKCFISQNFLWLSFFC